jgi:TonB family protein
MIAAMLGAARMSPASADAVVVPPHLLSKPQAKYPPTAIRQHHSGIVSIEVLIDKQGHAADVKVVRSSGYRELDAAAVESGKHFQFQPGTVDGAPVEGHLIVPIDFYMEPTWSPPADGTDEQIVRFLRESQFVSIFRHGLEFAIAKEGHSNAIIHAALAASDDDIIAAALPSYRKAFTLEQARATADFYATDTGKALVRQETASIDGLNPSSPLTKAQRDEVTTFEATEAGQAAIRTMQNAFVTEMNRDVIRVFKAKVAAQMSSSDTPAAPGSSGS